MFVPIPFSLRSFLLFIRAFQDLLPSKRNYHHFGQHLGAQLAVEQFVQIDSALDMLNLLSAFANVDPTGDFKLADVLPEIAITTDSFHRE